MKFPKSKPARLIFQNACCVVGYFRSHSGICKEEPKSWSCSELREVRGALGRCCLPARSSPQDPVQICHGVTRLVLACVLQLLRARTRAEIKHWVPRCFDPASKPLRLSPAQKPSTEKSPNCRQKMIPEVVAAQQAGPVSESLL